MRNVDGGLLEDNVVEGERVLQVPEQRELVDKTLVVYEGIDSVLCQD